MTHNRVPVWLTDFITKYLVPLELVFTLAALIGYFMQLAEAEYGSLIFGLGLTMLAIVYFLAGFAPASDDNLVKSIFVKTFYLGMSVTVVGIYFSGSQLPGSSVMLNIGLVTTVITMLLIVITSIKDWDITVTRLIIRGITVILLAVLIILNQQP